LHKFTYFTHISTATDTYLIENRGKASIKIEVVRPLIAHQAAYKFSMWYEVFFGQFTSNILLKPSACALGLDNLATPLLGIVVTASILNHTKIIASLLAHLFSPKIHNVVAICNDQIKLINSSLLYLWKSLGGQGQQVDNSIQH
jgi:hypothetical protein